MTHSKKPKLHGNKTARYFKQSCINDLERDKAFRHQTSLMEEYGDLMTKTLSPLTRGLAQHQYDNSRPMKRVGEDGNIEYRISPALMDWCTEVGQARLNSQKKMLGLERSDNIRIFIDEWLCFEHFKKLMRMGFSRSERAKAKAVMSWWEKEKRTAVGLYNKTYGTNKPLPTFVDTLNCEKLPVGLLRAYRNWC